MSSLEDGRTGSVPVQRAAIESIAALRGFRVVEWFEDPDLSAFNPKVKRPGYDEMMSRLGEVEAVIFYRLDRFTRRIAQFARAYETCETQGVALVSATEPIDTSTPIGIAAMEMIMVFAGLEARTTQARLRDHHAHLARTGRWKGGGVTPYGHRYNPATQQLEVDEDEADTIRTFVRAALTGVSLTRIVDAANRTGVVAGQPVVPARGKQWRVTRLRVLLRQPRLVGDREHRGVVVARDVFPPILSRATWKRLQATLDQQRLPSGRRSAGSPPVTWSGLLRCGSCGSTLYAHKQAGHRHWRCGSMGADGPGCPAPVHIGDSTLERLLLSELFDRVGRDDLVARIRKAQQAPKVQPKVAKRVARIDTALERAERGYVDGLIPETRFRRMVAELRDERDTLNIGTAAAPPRPPMRAVWLRDLPKLWGALTDAERHVAWTAAVEVVVVSKGPKFRFHRDDLSVTWRF